MRKLNLSSFEDNKEMLFIWWVSKASIWKSKPAFYFFESFSSYFIRLFFL